VTRRALLGFAIASSGSAARRDDDGRTPTDAEQLNRFATHYNTYIQSIKAGVVDLKLWARVRGAWRAMAE